MPIDPIDPIKAAAVKHKRVVLVAAGATALGVGTYFAVKFLSNAIEETVDSIVE